MVSLRLIPLLAAAFAAIGGQALAQDVCLRPVAPRVPEPEAARALSEAEMGRYRAARDEYFVAADAYLDCTNKLIELRLRAMFAANAPLDPGLKTLGEAHRTTSEERASVHERFVRMCMAWEDARNAPLPGQCGTIIESKPLPAPKP